MRGTGLWESRPLDNSQLLNRQVALKIQKADASESNQELDTYLLLSASNIDHQGRGHVLELLDHFRHDGPNGTHLCLVLPAMVSDGKDMTRCSLCKNNLQAALAGP
ncbi:hypothetical protein BJX68DRAFT_238636 [Aspergillus pseudodeflectus]|uniref:Uncharacterized protein n=1 Tax=Aspergillus pseudodeflectus TaxID=176178 RepID=A0ABR4K8Y2_9EURO